MSLSRWVTTSAVKGEENCRVAIPANKLGCGERQCYRRPDKFPSEAMSTSEATLLNLDVAEVVRLPELSRRMEL